MTPTFDQVVADHNTEQSPTWTREPGLVGSWLDTSDECLTVQAFPASARETTGTVRVTIQVTPPTSTGVTRALWTQAEVAVGPGTAYPCDPRDRDQVEDHAVSIIRKAAQSETFTHRLRGVQGRSYRVQGHNLNYVETFLANEARVLARVIDVSLRTV